MHGIFWKAAIVLLECPHASPLCETEKTQMENWALSVNITLAIELALSSRMRVVLPQLLPVDAGTTKELHQHNCCYPIEFFGLLSLVKNILRIASETPEEMSLA